MARTAFMVTAAAACLAHVTGAQVPAAVTQMAETTFTMAALQPMIEAFSVEPLRERITPSAALDRTADSLVAHWQRLGLQPGFPDVRPSAWMLRYPVPGQQYLSYTVSQLAFFATPVARGLPVLTESGEVLGRRTIANLASQARFVDEVATPAVIQPFVDATVSGPFLAGSERAALVAGVQTVAQLTPILESGELDERVVVYVPPSGTDTAVMRTVLAQLYAVSRGVVLIRPPNPIEFATAVAAGRASPLPLVDSYIVTAQVGRRWPWAVEVDPAVTAGVLAGVGVDLPALATTTTPVVRYLETLQVRLEPAVAPLLTAPITAPVIAASVPGTDPKLANQYLILATHLDVPPVAANTAAEAGLAASAANVAGLLALARAFRDPAVQLRRPILLVATSGEAGRLEAWGGHFLAQAILEEKTGLFRDFDFFKSALITFDVDKQNEGGTVAIDGQRALKLVPSPAWVAEAHPELKILLSGEQVEVSPGSTAGAFRRNYVASLALHSPVSDGDVSAAVKESKKSAVEHAARVLHYLFYLGYELANAKQPALWTAEGRRGFVEKPGP